MGLQPQDAPEPGEPAAPEVVCEVHPAHVDALNLFLACRGQFQLTLGGMGGASWRAALAANVAQEARWQGLHGAKQATAAAQYRVMEGEALKILNEREAQAARKT